MSKMNKFQYFLEIVWLIVAVFAVSAASYELYAGNNDRSIKMFVVAAIAVAVYSLRRFARMRRK